MKRIPGKAAFLRKNETTDMDVTFGDLKQIPLKMHKNVKLDKIVPSDGAKSHRRINSDFKPVFNSNFL